MEQVSSSNTPPPFPHHKRQLFNHEFTCSLGITKNNIWYLYTPGYEFFLTIKNYITNL